MFEVRELNGIYTVKIYDTDLIYCNDKRAAELIALILNIDRSENAFNKKFVDDLIDRISKVIVNSKYEQLEFDL